MKKRSVVVAAVVVSGAILAGGVLGIITFKATPSKVAPSKVAAASEPEPTPEPDIIYGDVPKWIQERGMVSFLGGSLYGKADEVYGTATTTFETWLKLEPGYALSQRKVTDKNRDDPIYAVFVRGKWEAVSPPVGTGGEETSEQPKFMFVAGRALLDKDGGDLNVQAWGEEKPARPAFGEPFNDQ
jgi:hypothetical protein